MICLSRDIFEAVASSDLIAAVSTPFFLAETGMLALSVDPEPKRGLNGLILPTLLFFPLLILFLLPKDSLFSASVSLITFDIWLLVGPDF